MTDGPYNSSIRGPGENALGGIWSLLNSIVGGLGSLPQIATDIAAIRVVAERDIPLLLTRLSYLTGENPPDNGFSALGLPRYMTQLFGTRQEASNEGNTMFALLRNDWIAATQIVQMASGTNGFYNGSRNVLRENRDFVAQLASSLGNAATSSPNFTALAWLALIANSTERSADCCEEGSAPPAPTNNPPPAGFCVPANAVRQVSWNAIGTRLANGVVSNVFRPVFDFSNGVNAPLSATGALGSEPTAPALRFSGNIDITFCVSWDFTGTTPPTAFGRYFGINQATTESNDDLSGPLNAPSTLTVGGLADDRNTCDGIERYGAHNFAFPVGVTPSLNVFLGVTQSRGCPQ